MSKIALYITWPGGMTVVIRNATNKIVGRSKPGPKGTPLFKRQVFRLPDCPKARLSLTETIFRSAHASNLPVPMMLRENDSGEVFNDVGEHKEVEPPATTQPLPGQAAALPPSQQDVFNQLKEFGSLSRVNIETLCSASPSVTAKALKALESKGVIRISDDKYQLV